RFFAQIMENLRHDLFAYCPYNCKTDALCTSVTVSKRAVNIVEGVYSLHPTLAHRYDLTVFLGIDAVTQSERILKRAGSVMHKRFVEEWIPLENRYFGALSIPEQCDLVYNLDRY
ncbi:MAG: hypothetical protein ACERKO_12960, partial [Acetanaerobacterium sp.]